MAKPHDSNSFDYFAVPLGCDCSTGTQTQLAKKDVKRMKPRTAHLVGRSVGLLPLFSTLNPQATKAQAGVLETTSADAGMWRPFPFH
jgi:hypothetical protein